ncbi:phosphate/phosphite/phosphonate ABC transporter substrate-binding protein [Tumebacillus lipolyticus]|uniref:Phosphate/phosphite/phosphonate ABC transporter substrate-binding protein n=1 Tax=Tumebacillus lipolyticus TaxID=1280370 RepID=A0ABW4ZUC8_9BACL
MFKKTFAVGMTLALAATLVGCGSDDKKGGDANTPEKDPEKLTVGFIPSQNAENLSAKAKPLGDLLSKELGIPVEVQVTTNFNGLVEGMAAKKVDVGFLNPINYVFAHDKKKAVKVLLQTERNGADYYRAMFVKRADNKDINKLEDIKGKKVAFVDASSAAGYIYPAVMMKDLKLNPETDVKPTLAGGHDKAMMALLRGDVDVATVFEDARDTILKEVPDVKEKLVPFAYSDKIPNDTVSIRNGFSDEFNKKVADAFMKIMKTDEGKKIGKEIYSFDNLVPSDDKNFDPVRKAVETMGLEPK